MDTFFILWEITFPLVIIGIVIYVIFSMMMYQYLQVGDFRKSFTKGGQFVKIGHILMFLLYLPVYLLLVLFGIY